MKRLRKFFAYVILFTFFSCVKSNDFELLSDRCNDDIASNEAIENIFNLSTSTAVKYTEDTIIEGYVVSSDQGGNFFKILSLQALNGSIGFSIPIDQSDLYTIYNPGRKVYVHLNNIYTEIDNGALEIGDLFIDNFSNERVGRIAYPAYENILLKSCESVDENRLVQNLAIRDIDDTYLNTLIEFTDIQFVEEALGRTLYDSALDMGGSATNHLLEDTSGNTLIFRTSAFADFASLNVPEESGTIRGVLTKFNGAYQLLIRTFSDVILTNDRFQVELKNNLFFTELADPNNNSKARFIEIYNAEEEAVNLNGWTIRRYTNDNTTVSSTLDLSGNIIESNQAFVIAANASGFEAVFGFAPNLAVGTNGPADSNGDDNLELVDSEGNVVDIFGVIGEDGSGTNHEFEDGRAQRKVSIITGNSIFTFTEWNIWNDTGSAGTTNEPQNAPENFTPGIR
ncbi:MAG: DUF5689 domain-containing protein [Flavobacteriaceae bacterium]|nr:DUF5689 domain-containing protein [Flavobacteriaceae bacterium]